MAYWKLLGYWCILARKICFTVVKCCVFNELMWLKSVGISLAASSATQCEMEPEMEKKTCAQKHLLMRWWQSWRPELRLLAYRFCSSCRHFPALWACGCCDQGAQESCFGFVCFSLSVSVPHPFFSSCIKLQTDSRKYRLPHVECGLCHKKEYCPLQHLTLETLGMSRCLPCSIFSCPIHFSSFSSIKSSLDPLSDLFSAWLPPCYQR